MEINSNNAAGESDAPRGNALRHGLRAAIGRLPKGCAWLKSLVSTMRRELERAVVARKGQVELYDSCLIQSACRWEQHGLLAQRWLRLNADTLSDADRLAYSREIAKASSERDKCLERLGLDKDARRDVWDAVFKEERSAPHIPLSGTDPQKNEEPQQ